MLDTSPKGPPASAHTQAGRLLKSGKLCLLEVVMASSLYIMILCHEIVTMMRAPRRWQRQRLTRAWHDLSRRQNQVSHRRSNINVEQCLVVVSLVSRLC